MKTGAMGNRRNKRKERKEQADPEHNIGKGQGPGLVLAGFAREQGEKAIQSCRDIASYGRKEWVQKNAATVEIKPASGGKGGFPETTQDGPVGADGGGMGEGEGKE